MYVYTYVRIYPLSEGIRLAMSVQERDGSGHNSVSTSNQKFGICVHMCDVEKLNERRSSTENINRESTKASH